MFPQPKVTLCLADTVNIELREFRVRPGKVSLVHIASLVGVMVWISLVISGSQSEARLRERGTDHARASEYKTFEADIRALPLIGLGPGVAERPVAVKIDVTTRQLECLTWVAHGKSATEIGIILGISGRTVEKHIAKVCEVFGVVRRIQAVDYARRLGLISQ